MRKVIINDVPLEPWASPKGKLGCRSRNISLALGRVERSDLKSESHPFDLELCTAPAGKAMCPYHSHSAQTEMYVVVAGCGKVRSVDGYTDIGPGDAFIFKPHEPHQMIASATEDLTYYIIADDPPGESCYYPDSDKWSVPAHPKRHILKGTAVDYHHGEE